MKAAAYHLLHCCVFGDRMPEAGGELAEDDPILFDSSRFPSLVPPACLTTGTDAPESDRHLPDPPNPEAVGEALGYS